MNRICGDCTLCCRVVPVADLHKGANQRCRHQTHKGCRVYARLDQVSPSCRLWSCQWLVNPDAGELRRPDRAHYVIDIMPDFVGVQDNATGETRDLPVMQIWADPQHPDAWRHDMALRRYIERACDAEGLIAVIRFSATEAVVLVPPRMAHDGEWHEQVTKLPSSDTDWVNPMQAMLEEGRAMRRARERSGG